MSMYPKERDYLAEERKESEYEAKQERLEERRIKQKAMQNETIEGNKLISAFYGAAYNHVQDYYLIKDFSFMGKPEEMRFHSSWDWLMPVVDKCKNIDTEYLYAFYAMNGYLAQVNIKQVWGEVVKYIKWYNKTNSMNIEAEDVKRWFQLLVGKGENAMKEDIAKTFKAEQSADVLQPSDIEACLNITDKKIFDELGWTGEYHLSAKDILDLLIDKQTV